MFDFQDYRKKSYAVMLQFHFDVCVLCTLPDFVPSLRRLFKNRVYTMIILTYLVAVNGFIGMITFKPKFLEQVYGQSASKAIFLIGTGDRT